MPLSTNPETLRIPAFMRKRSLHSRLAKPLILTALDRKNANLPPLSIKKPQEQQGETIKFKYLGIKPKKASPKIGTITHYYDKIKVGILLLATRLSVGDFITFETQDGGTYQQLIESMEINREPVFTAKKGQEVGIKLMKAPKMGGNVM